MSDLATKLAALRAALAHPMTAPDTHGYVPTGHPGVDACLRGGLRRGALHEIFAESGHEAATTGFAAALAFRIAGRKRMLWIRQDFAANEFGGLEATGLLELGLDPARLLLLNLTDAADVLRAGGDALSCAALGALVIELSGEPKPLDLNASRRLALAGAEKGVTTFLLRLAAQPRVSTAETRWRVRAAASPHRDEDWGFPAFGAELVRSRHGRTGRWIMAWSCDDGFFRESEATADLGAVAAPPADRPAAAAQGIKRPA